MAVLAAFLIVGLMPAAPAAAAGESDYWSLMSNTVDVVRGGTTYKMTLFASGFGAEGADFSIQLSKTLNPSGLRKSTQSHYFTWPLDDDGVFVHNDLTSLASAKVDTNSDMNPFGTALVRFAKTSGVTNTCKSGGKILRATGTLSGTMAFKTGTDRFGKIDEMPSKATLVRDDGNCVDGGGGFTYCPRNVGFFGDRATDGFSIGATRTPGSDVVSVSAAYNKTMSGDGSRYSSIYATLPEDQFSIASDLSEGTVAGMKQTYLSGRANFEKTAAASTAEDNPCFGSEATYDRTSRPGVIRGSMIAKFWFGGARDLSEQKLVGSATRYKA